MSNTENRQDRSSDREQGRRTRGGRASKRVSRELVKQIDYKNPRVLEQFITERGKILPRRITGLSGKQQRQLALAIRRARMIALLPFTVTGK